ncbi:MAG: hypothetical protein Edafosvirus38_6 [Edafosvirus sp.]|uniref:DUF72 domain-containing protein n=1 Tax=Edafosvirus sp. TaxID=2487765 RepID=A0A3G4ZVD9_9VIRU|nr:MAG: hypothetical protein Edafosvirus38_6 [Edafosvirus sp.]
MENIFIGTSGFSYSSWHSKGSFYPPNIKTKDEFNYYSNYFNTVELNVTFYNIPKVETWQHWYEQAKNKNFLYIIKANKFFTHQKKLNVDNKFKEVWKMFMKRCKILKNHLGPILFQFSNSFNLTNNNLKKLNNLGKFLPKWFYVFEFRNITMFNDDVYKILKNYNWCLAAINVNNWSVLPNGFTPKLIDYPLSICNWGVYIKFHGSKGQYVGNYENKILKESAKFLNKTNLNVFAIFNNTDSNKPPSAIIDALTLKKYIE